MQTVQTSLFARDDTFFGVCQGLGEDLGISPNILRLALALALFFNPLATLAAYAGAGALVFASRWLFPAPRLAVADEDAAAEQADAIELPEIGAAAADQELERLAA